MAEDSSRRRCSLTTYGSKTTKQVSAPPQETWTTETTPTREETAQAREETLRSTLTSTVARTFSTTNSIQRDRAKAQISISRRSILDTWPCQVVTSSNRRWTMSWRISREEILREALLQTKCKRCK